MDTREALKEITEIGFNEDWRPHYLMKVIKSAKKLVEELDKQIETQEGRIEDLKDQVKGLYEDMAGEDI